MDLSQQQREPTSYQGWLARLANVTAVDAIINAATKAAAMNPDKRQARHDVAVLIFEKYSTEKKRGLDNEIVERTVKSKFESLAKSLFGGSLNKLIDYVESSQGND